MGALPTVLYRAAQVRELDRIAIEERGVPGYTLMCRAGETVFAALRARWPEARRLVVVCGGGNNAGDGYVVARLARQAGLDACVLYLRDPEKLVGDARKAFVDARQAGVSARLFEACLLGDGDVLVDAILGTGLEREVAGAWAEAIDAINGQPAGRLAVDIPSGLHADRGAVLGSAVRADLTVTFIGLKQGLFTGQGPSRCGEVLFSDLGVPDDIYGRVPSDWRRYAGEDLSELLPPRPRSGHKGDNGHVLVVGGDQGMAGAVRMAAEAAARCGAGLVSVATRAAHAGLQAAARPELMFHGVETSADLAPLLERATAMAVGPGLGRSDWGRAMLAAALTFERPMVVDADGLNLLAESPRRHATWILTPHPGEAARLLGTTSGQVEADRFEAATRLVARYGGTCVLKGAGSLIAREKGAMTLCNAGNPGMGSGGMGDVLTGVIAGLLAQGLECEQAARAGVYVHARAGDLAAVAGERGLLAMDLMAHLRALVNPPVPALGAVMTTAMTLSLASVEATEELGAGLAHIVLGNACIVYLGGDLGAGKTTLARGFLRGLGYVGRVKSPTYTVVETYQVEDIRAFHFDLYRLVDPEELEYIGFRDYVDGRSILLIEWPEHGLGVLPPEDLRIEMTFAGDAIAGDGRFCQLTAHSALGEGILVRLRGGLPAEG